MASSRDAQHARFCFEALSQLGAKRQGGGRTNPPPTPSKVSKCPTLARVNDHVAKIQVSTHGVKQIIFLPT